jgi:hypothetical protein
MASKQTLVKFIYKAFEFEFMLINGIMSFV